MTACPCCGQSLLTPKVTLDDRVRELDAACQTRGYFVTPDGRVREDTAATLLGLAPGTLRNWSYLCDGRLPFVKVANRRTYRLADIARLLMAEE